MNNKVDIIIPAYKAQGTIMRTLSSIATQTILSDIEVTIVNDCCPNGDYQEFIKIFSKYFPVREIKMPENVGGGLARQKGIDETHNTFLTFIDADDAFATPVALQVLRQAMKDGNNGDKNPVKLVSGSTIEIEENLEYRKVFYDKYTVHGKMYRRDFINKYNIHFSNIRAAEDDGFITWFILLCDNPDEQFKLINDPVICYFRTPDSITTVNNRQYYSDQGLIGHVDNLIYTIKQVLKIRPESQTIVRNLIYNILDLYTRYVDLYETKSAFTEQLWEYIKKFYHSFKFSLPQDIDYEKEFSNIYQPYDGTCVSVSEFAYKLKHEKYNPKDIYEVWKRVPEELKRNNIRAEACSENFYDAI